MEKRVETKQGTINMASVYDIVKGISQAAANAYDGAHDATLQPLTASPEQLG